MSIYLFSQQINKNIDNNVIDIGNPKIIASAEKKGEKIILPFEKYNETRLQKFVETKSYNNIIVSPYFWNYNYCKLNMLDKKNKFESLETPNTMLVDIDLFFAGNFLLVLTFFNILDITYCETSENDYDKFLNRINVDRKVFADFMIKNQFKLPLTYNLKKLILRIFTGDNILNYVLLPNLFTVKEIAEILNHFDYGSLNMASEYIFNSYLSDKERLCLCQYLIEEYPVNIDNDRIIYLNLRKFKPYLCYYLYTMEVPSELVNIYYYVWKLFKDNGGAMQLIMVRDEVLNDKIQQRYNALKDNFKLK